MRLNETAKRGEEKRGEKRREGNEWMRMTCLSPSRTQFRMLNFKGTRRLLHLGHRLLFLNGRGFVRRKGKHTLSLLCFQDFRGSLDDIRPLYVLNREKRCRMEMEPRREQEEEEEEEEEEGA